MRWVDSLIGRDNYATAAKRAGFDASAFSRWRGGGNPDVERALMLAAAYGATPIEALIAMGVLDEGDAVMPTRSSIEVIREARPEALLDELLLRIRELERQLTECRASLAAAT